MQIIEPLDYSKWIPRDEIAPVLDSLSSDDRIHLRATSNGSPGCYGGWDIVYPAPEPTENAYLYFEIKVRWQDLERGYDSLKVLLVWIDEDGKWARDWEPIFPVSNPTATDNYVLYRGEARISPKGGTRLACRLILSWTRTGTIEWWDPQLRLGPAPLSRVVRLGATGVPHPRDNNTIESNTHFYLDLCHKAAEEHVDILCLPEIMLQVGMPSTAADVARLAVTAPGKEIEPFQKFAQSAGMTLCFSIWERNRELIHNSALLIDKRGEIAGKYHKVHLALPSEPWQGITPGHDFPVYSIDDAVIGMNICMDTSASESMRVPARRGAEVLLMPIMGDHRATPLWDGSDYVFDMKRWCMIHCVHAMDNQLYIVTGVNDGIGSGVFAPNGDVLALSDGTQPVVWADVDLNAQIRPWSGTTARNMLWAERREPAYGLLLAQPDPFAATRQELLAL